MTTISIPYMPSGLISALEAIPTSPERHSLTEDVTTLASLRPKYQERLGLALSNLRPTTTGPKPARYRSKADKQQAVRAIITTYADKIADVIRDHDPQQIRIRIHQREQDGNLTPQVATVIRVLANARLLSVPDQDTVQARKAQYNVLGRELCELLGLDYERDVRSSHHARQLALADTMDEAISLMWQWHAETMDLARTVQVPWSPPPTPSPGEGQRAAWAAQPDEFLERLRSLPPEEVTG